MLNYRFISLFLISYIFTSSGCFRPFDCPTAGSFLLAYGLKAVWLLMIFGLSFSYMIIGLTSLCLYNNTDFCKKQYGKLYKLNKSGLYKMQKTVFMHKIPVDIFCLL